MEGKMSPQSAYTRQLTLTFNTRELRQVVDYNLAGVDMIVNKGDTCSLTVTSQSRHSSKAESSRPKNFLGAVGTEFGFFLQKRTSELLGTATLQ